MDVAHQIVTQPNKLSKEQSDAVLAEERFIKVIAGAGAGKTETLTRRIAYLLLVKKIKPSEIVAFTFTEKAARSMKDRIYQRIGGISGPEATKNLGEMFIGTIHGYAKLLLDNYFGFGNYDVLDENQEVAFLMRHGWDLGVKEYGTNYFSGCRNFQRTINMVWDEMLDREDLKRRAPEFNNSLTKYEALLDDNKQLTFGRMMYLVASALQKRDDIIEKVKYLIVDEYQDINHAQAVLIETIGKKSEVFVVGDPRQSIYQWRGSDERFFNRYSKIFKGAKEINIIENRRSTKLIVDNANRFANSFKKIKFEEMKSVRKENGFLGLTNVEDPESEAEWIADQIESLVKQKRVKYSDVGILMRSVSTSGGPLIDELRERRIPFLVGGKVGLFRRDEAKAVGKIFCWLWDDGFWVENPFKWTEQLKGDALIESAITNWEDAIGGRMPTDIRERIDELILDLHEKPKSYKNITEIYRKLLHILGFHNLDHLDRNDSTMMANLGRFSELLTDYETANRLGGRTPRWDRDLKGLCWFLNSYALQAYEEISGEDLGKVDAVQIMTVHQAKGLEWPMVFLTSMVASRFPSKMIEREQNWCQVPRDMFDVKRYEGSIEDERRLFYVAITRAKDALDVIYFQKINRSVSRSEFIEDMRLDLVTQLDENDVLPCFKIIPETEKEEMQTYSSSEIIAYNQCPYMYLLGVIWGFQPGLHPKIGYGKSLHFCLRRASELVKTEKFNPLSAVATAVEEGFHMPFAGGEMLDDFKKSGKETLIEFARKYEGDFGRIEEVEYRLEFPIQGATISGKVDVILRNETNLEVREYKTSEEAKSFEESSIQVQLYTLGLRCLGRPVTRGSIAYLEEAEIKEVPIKDAGIAQVKIDAERTVKAIMERRFIPNAGNKCKECDQREVCRWGYKK